MSRLLSQPRPCGRSDASEPPRPGGAASIAQVVAPPSGGASVVCSWRAGRPPLSAGCDAHRARAVGGGGGGLGDAAVRGAELLGDGLVAHLLLGRDVEQLRVEGKNSVAIVPAASRSSPCASPAGGRACIRPPATSPPAEALMRPRCRGVAWVRGRRASGWAGRRRPRGLGAFKPAATPMPRPRRRRRRSAPAAACPPRPRASCRSSAWRRCRASTRRAPRRRFAATDHLEAQAVPRPEAPISGRLVVADVGEVRRDSGSIDTFCRSLSADALRSPALPWPAARRAAAALARLRRQRRAAPTWR